MILLFWVLALFGVFVAALPVLVAQRQQRIESNRRDLMAAAENELRRRQGFATFQALPTEYLMNPVGPVRKPRKWLFLFVMALLVGRADGCTLLVPGPLQVSDDRALLLWVLVVVTCYLCVGALGLFVKTFNPEEFRIHLEHEVSNGQ